MPSVYKLNEDENIISVLEAMRLKLAKEFGVTVTGNRVTLRWYIDGEFVDVHMIIESVTTPKESKDNKRRHAEYDAILAKVKEHYPDINDDIFHAETNEWSQ